LERADFRFEIQFANYVRDDIGQRTEAVRMIRIPVDDLGSVIILYSPATQRLLGGRHDRDLESALRVAGEGASDGSVVGRFPGGEPYAFRDLDDAPGEGEDHGLVMIAKATDLHHFVEAPADVVRP